MNKTLKKMRFLSTILIIALISCAPLAEDSFLIQNNGSIMGLKIGDSIDSVYTRFGHDDKIIRMANLGRYAEGQFVPGLEIYLNGSEEPSFDIMIKREENNWIIHWIDIFDKRFRTKKNIGAGSTLGDLKKAYEIDGVDELEGRLYIDVKGFDGMFIMPGIIKSSDDVFGYIADDSEIKWVRTFRRRD